MDVRNLDGKWALVTGAGSGIGQATALALAQRGADLVLCDVDETGLKQTETRAASLGRKTLALRVDVSRREEMASFAEAVHRQLPAVDILVNNAGVAVGARFDETSLEDWDWVIGVNLWGVIHGVHFFVPRMLERGASGHVVNIASMAGIVAFQTLGAYSTTKFAVCGLSESLRAELLPHGIGVTAICPGFVDTAILQSARMRGRASQTLSQGELLDFVKRHNHTPYRVARSILRAIQRNRALAPVFPEAWVGYYLKRFAPRALTWVMRRASERTERAAARR